MPKCVIHDTSLCAIVRDEINNPAGGIVDFIESTMPFLEAGVVVDTGSADGTWDLLKKMCFKYPNLKIYHRSFDNFSNSRNFSLKNVKTKRALVLDADERLTEMDFYRLKKLIKKKSSLGYNFYCVYVYPNNNEIKICNNPRLFEISKKTHYRWVNGREVLYLGNKVFAHIPKAVVRTHIKIKHFCPDKKFLIKKREEFYKKIMRGVDIQPSKCSSFAKWKKYNPKIKLYK